jgi:hypothetical protein
MGIRKLQDKDHLLIQGPSYRVSAKSNNITETCSL